MTYSTSFQNDPYLIAYKQQGYYQTQPIQGEVSETQNVSYLQQGTPDVLEISAANETCTDGKDDGKIPWYSKTWNAVKGIGKGIGKMVKGAFTDENGKLSVKQTLKTAALAAVCCIPYVGPAIGIGLAAKGAYNGVKTIANGIAVANSATTDAEAKLAWQTIGQGSFTTAACVVAAKAGVNVLKGQVSALYSAEAAQGSGAANIAKLANGKGLTGLKSAGLKKVAGAAIKDTGANISAAASTIKKKTWDKGKNTYKSIRENGITETARTGLENVRIKINNKLDNINNKLDYLDNRIADKANAKALVDQAYMDGAKNVETYLNGQIKKATYSDGSVVEYSRSGEVIRTSNPLSKNTTNTISTKGNVTTNEYTTVDTNGNVVSGSRTTTNDFTNVSRKESLGSSGNGYQKATSEIRNTKTNTGIQKQTTLFNDKAQSVVTERTYTLNGETLTDPTLLQKAQVRLQTNNTYQGINNGINKYYNGVQNLTHLSDAELYGLGILTYANDEQ